MSDAGEIDKIIFHLHVKFRPSHHPFHTGIDCGDRYTFFRSTHSCKGRIIRQ